MNKLEVFDSIKDTSHLCGGDEKIKMQHNLNKLTTRERVLSLLDEGSFVEVGAMISGNGAGVITGHGTINGRLVFVYSHDYTLDGGAFTKTMGRKIVNILESAAKIGAPIIQVIDSIGGKLNEGVELLGAYGLVLNKYGKLSGVVPRISVICGPSNGLVSLLATMSDITVAVNEISDLSVSSLGNLITKEGKYLDKTMLGDGKSSNRNGNAHINTTTEEEAFEVVKKVISYIPSNNLELPVLSEEDYNLNIAKDNLDKMVESDNVSLDEVLNSIADEDSIIEIYKDFAENFRTAFVKINGLTVGVILNSKSKEIDNAGANKVSSFVRLCDSFNISILTLVDTKGAVVSVEEENNGLAKNIGKLMYSLIDTTVPKVSLVIGEAYGLGYEVLASKESAFDVTLAWPTAKVCLTIPESYIKGLYKDEIFNSGDHRQGEKDLVAKYYEEVTNPYTVANNGMVDDIIKPSESKQRIFAILDMLQSKREVKYPKSHGSTLV
ncbi:MAG: carboxyl transferase domain-containing protein [Clostridium sp.]|uniref:carboxyl transferase domain-containing protein n=1 Tax=Clostridium sp. TaxID=1506 RepID=UPI00302AC4CD